ncbi:hypothetical protein SNEBB_007502 [Seison nebaliae]|nr:hypothetical protein SNEBB_007502 [Seison nebaliae]
MESGLGKNINPKIVKNYLENSHQKLVDLSDVNLVEWNDVNDLPISWDWRKKGIVTPVHDQGAMGQAVPIVLTELIESAYAQQTGQLTSMSLSQIIDCCRSSPFISDYVKCIEAMRGICSQEQYPHQYGYCHHCQPVVDVNSFDLHTDIIGNEIALAKLLMNETVFVTIDSSHTSFLLYEGGIYDEPNCSSTTLDHPMQLVGFGQEDNEDFWIIRNSWGLNWGEHGYIRMRRNHHNECGISTYVWSVEIELP